MCVQEDSSAKASKVTASRNVQTFHIIVGVVGGSGSGGVTVGAGAGAGVVVCTVVAVAPVSFLYFWLKTVGAAVATKTTYGRESERCSA